jgi:serine O-acetyltransferase
MKIINLEASHLPTYVRTQIAHFFPLGEDPELQLIDSCMKEALARLEHCIAQVKMWTPGQFDVLHSSQYCIFLYYLSNTIWRKEKARTVCTKLFLLNKALNAIDCFYEIELPEVFFIGHSVGIVLAKASYGNHLVLYQNSTVGKNHGQGPIIGNGVILYPNTAIIGKCQVGDGTTLSQGASLIDQDSPGSCLVFRATGPGAVIKPTSRRYTEDYFRFT